MATSDPTSPHTDSQTPAAETYKTDIPEEATPVSADAATAESSSKPRVEETKPITETASREDRDATPPLEFPEVETEKPAEKTSDHESAVPNETGGSDKRAETSVSKPNEKAPNVATSVPKSDPQPANKPTSKPCHLLKSHSTPPETREYFENLSLDSKRRLYRCGQRYKQLKDLETWPSFHAAHNCSSKYKLNRLLPEDSAINEKVSLWRGDITSLEIDAIVNAANRTLLGGGGVDGAIHDAAGRSLHRECYALNGCETGESKLSGGYKLPAKYIIHTVGPMGEREDQLASCYLSCLRLVEEYNIKSIAFCCISTGIYGYPNMNAAKTALQIVRSWFEKSEYAKTRMERVIFCVFLKVDYQIYSELMCNFFPIPVVLSPDKKEMGDKEDTPPVEDKEHVVPQAHTGVPLLKSAVTAPAAIIAQQLPPAEGNKAEAKVTECVEATRGVPEVAGEGGATASESERVEPTAKLPKLDGEEAVTGSDAEPASAKNKKDTVTELMVETTQDPSTEDKSTAEKEKNI